MSKSTRLRLGTRASALARWQAEWITKRLEDLGVSVEIIHVSTQGDVTTGPLGQAGGQGLFTKEIQRRLLGGSIDLAVHSLKDLPTDVEPGLTLAAVPKRETPWDAIVMRSGDSLGSLSEHAKVGTGSTRRRAQLLFARPDLEIHDIRGNVETRLKKLDDGEFEGIVLACAGLTRLGLEHRISYVLPSEIMMPAVGQGALGIEARQDDAQTLEILAQLNHADSRAAVVAERTLLARLRGGCLAPVGALARVVEAGRLRLSAVVMEHNGGERIVADDAGAIEMAEALGRRAAQSLLGQGAAALIQASRDSR